MDTIELYVQESYIVTLKGLGGTGYQWTATTLDPQLVQVEQMVTSQRMGEYPPGSSRDEQYLLTGLALGETIVHFVQARSFEPKKPPHATYDIMVCVVLV